MSTYTYTYGHYTKMLNFYFGHQKDICRLTISPALVIVGYLSPFIIGDARSIDSSRL